MGLSLEEILTSCIYEVSVPPLYARSLISMEKGGRPALEASVGILNPEVPLSIKMAKRPLSRCRYGR